MKYRPSGLRYLRWLWDAIFRDLKARDLEIFSQIFWEKKTRFSMWLRSLSWDGKSNNIATSVGHCHLCSWILRFSLNESESWFSRFANRNSNSKFSNGGWRFSMKINNIGITNYLIMAFHEKIITFHSVIKWSTLTF